MLSGNGMRTDNASRPQLMRITLGAAARSGVSGVETVKQGVWLIAVELFGSALFLTGLIGPLTPSGGAIRLSDIAVFVGVPLGLFALVAARARTSAGRIGAAVQTAAAVILGTFVLGRFGGFW